MLHDAGSAGSRMPSSPTTSTPATKQTEKEASDDRFSLRRRRKTDSAVHPSIHAVQRESPVAKTARISRLSMMDFPPSSPTARSEYSSLRRQDAVEGDPPDSRPFQLARSKSTGRLRSATLERRSTGRTTNGDDGDDDDDEDPRDTGRSGALTFAGTTSTTTATSKTTTTTTTTTPSRSKASFLSSPRPASTSPSSPSSHSHRPSLSALPRLPQSRFSFEYPLRKIALTSHLRYPSFDHDTPASGSTFTPKRTLYDRHRRSVPDFSLSHVDIPAASETSQFAPIPSTTTQGPPESALSLNAGSAVRGLSPNATKRRKSSLYSQQTPPDVKRRMPSSSATFVHGRTHADEKRTSIKGADRYGQQDGLHASIADDSRSKNEDIFLNIARSDSGRRESLGRSELRRSRLRMSGNGLRSSTSHVPDQTPSPEQLRLNTYESPLHHSQNGSPSAPYSYSASAHPLEETGRSPQSSFASSSRSAIGLPRSRLSRASPEDEPVSDRRSSLHDSRSFRHSTLSTIRSSRQASGSEATERPRYDPDKSRQDGTESTLSTTAPSTVWDELEDLKSRIKKLELTGKLPPSSQEAISSASGERPRTATTTVTTLSSSPRHRRISVSAESDTVTAASPVHPLLQSALTKARSAVSREVYAALEATATDAMALSSILTGKTPSGSVSVVNGYSSTERQSKRKAESVCRSLTELCLALSDEQHLRQQASDGDATLRISQPNGTDEGTITPTLSYRKSMSREPEELSRRQSVPRAASRLEARRASLANNGDHHPSPDDTAHAKNHDTLQDNKQTQPPSSAATSSRLSRLSVALRAKRLQTDDEPSDRRNPHTRSISRSMTDIGGVSSAQGPSPRQRTSFGYTAPQSIAQQPSQPRTPTTPQSGIPLRRSLATPSLYTPATSRANIQAGSRRYSHAPAAVEGSSDDMPLSPRQEVLQTKIVAPSSKLATSYTPIVQNRLRTNSLGARRFGLRQPRPIPTTQNSRSFDDSLD